jgi:integrase/recombinase XerD
MSMDDLQKKKQQAAQQFGLETDPLAKYETKCESLPLDPFDAFLEEMEYGRGKDEQTIQRKERVVRQWREWMGEQGRHPACPNEDHVKGFIQWRRELGNAENTISRKVGILASIYNYWTNEDWLPHDSDYHPVRQGRSKVNLSLDPEDEQEDYPRISLETHRERVSEINHIRDKAIVVLQLKLGLRAGEVANIRLQDFHIHNQRDQLREHYPEMGTHDKLDGHRDAIYVPPSFERGGNKSDRPRTLPLDEEARTVLLRYLLIRPDVDEPELFLSKKSFVGLRPEDVTLTWARHYDEFDKDEDTRNVRSHYGRHFFTTHFEIEKQWPTQRVQWMRGDKLQNSDWANRQSIDHYLHQYYPDVEQRYRDQVFSLKV